MGFKPDLDDRLVSFSALTLLVWSFGLERLISEMTYYVSSGTLNPTHSLTHSSCSSDLLYVGAAQYRHDSIKWSQKIDSCATIRST